MQFQNDRLLNYKPNLTIPITPSQDQKSPNNEREFENKKQDSCEYYDSSKLSNKINNSFKQINSKPFFLLTQTNENKIISTLPLLSHNLTKSKYKKIAQAIQKIPINRIGKNIAVLSSTYKDIQENVLINSVKNSRKKLPSLPGKNRIQQKENLKKYYKSRFNFFIQKK